MAAPDHDRLEALLAEALAAFDDGGEAGLQAYLGAHPADRLGLERGLARCRQMGLLGTAAPVRDFPERLGEFHLLRRIGSGGMGVVYEADQESLGRRVALKVVRPELLYFEGARERFRREIEAVARLSHPAVVPVLASGEQEGVLWYAMELLHGRTVHEICNTMAGKDPASLSGTDLRAALSNAAETGTDPFHGPWWQLCVRIGHTIALGVRHAHVRGIVHRDIKPSNVILTGDGRTVLVDFGVAMVGGGREFTRTGNTPGSPAFMSPEQLRGDAVDERTDVYSLAATLWQMLTLTPPFAANGELLRARTSAPPSARAKNRQVPRELEVVLQKAMDPDRERRYHDAEAFAEDLQAVLNRRPIRARRLNWSLRSWRWCQRHRVAATAMACVLAGLFTIPAMLAWSERDTNRALAEAADRERDANRTLSATARVADESLNTALDAIYGLIVRVSDQKLRYVPTATTVARDALRDACTMYRELRRKHPAHQRLRLDSSRALSRLGELLAHMGDLQGSIADYREGIGCLDGLATDLAPLLLESRAILRCNLAGTLESAGQPREAIAELVLAEQDIAALPDGEDTRLRKLRLLSMLETMRAGALDVMSAPLAAEEHLRQALAHARRAFTPKFGDAADQRNVVECMDALATFLSKTARFDEAEALLNEALGIAREVPEEARIWPPPAATVANVDETLGNLYVERRDQRCTALLKECLAIREKLAADFPHDMQCRSDLAAALHNLASMNFYQAQDDLALERLDRAIALQRSVLEEAPLYGQAHDYLRNHLALRGSCLAKLGHRDELVATARELEKLDSDRAALRSAARLWLRATGLLNPAALEAPALATQRAAGLRKALDLLLAAERLGWGAGDPLGQKLYEPLRDMPEFEALRQRRKEAEAAHQAPRVK
jgi:serine/threonine protein kinase/tetratricopeptide (TPR) repeat protein